MDELKTLKDLETSEVECIGGTFDQHINNIVEANKLREEAIKWHKHLKEVTSEHDVWDFIETFFNIKEEEL